MQASKGTKCSHLSDAWYWFLHVSFWTAYRLCLVAWHATPSHASLVSYLQYDDDHCKSVLDNLPPAADGQDALPDRTRFQYPAIDTEWMDELLQQVSPSSCVIPAIRTSKGCQAKR